MDALKAQKVIKFKELDWEPRWWMSLPLLVSVVLLILPFTGLGALLSRANINPLQFLFGSGVVFVVSVVAVLYEFSKGIHLCRRLKNSAQSKNEELPEVTAATPDTYPLLHLTALEIWHTDWKSLVLGFTAVSLSWIAFFSWITLFLGSNVLRPYILYISGITIGLDGITAIVLYYSFSRYLKLFNDYYKYIEQQYRRHLLTVAPPT